MMKTCGVRVLEDMTRSLPIPSVSAIRSTTVDVDLMFSVECCQSVDATHCPICAESLLDFGKLGKSARSRLAHLLNTDPDAEHDLNAWVDGNALLLPSTSHFDKFSFCTYYHNPKDSCRAFFGNYPSITSDSVLSSRTKGLRAALSPLVKNPQNHARFVEGCAALCDNDGCIRSGPAFELRGMEWVHYG